MRWFLGIVGFVAALAAIALGVGFFLLPARLDIVRSADLDRPPATTFALVDSLRSFADISPWAEFDPNAGFSITGPWRGAGQKMAWASTHPALQTGGLELTAATPASRADLAVTIGDLPKAALGIDFRPAATGARLTWTWRQTCPSGFEGVACRYRLAVLRKDLTPLAELGLQRWARRASVQPSGRNPRSKRTHTRWPSGGRPASAGGAGSAAGAAGAAAGSLPLTISTSTTLAGSSPSRAT